MIRNNFPFHISISIDDVKLMSILAHEQFYDKDRSKISVVKNSIIVTASDYVALKASLNGIMKLIEVYYTTKKLVTE